MQELIEQRIDGGRRSVTVNRAESPLSWLRARGLVDARQYEAGERLRADYETASLGPRVTMRWNAMPVARGCARRRHAARPDPGRDRRQAPLRCRGGGGGSGAVGHIVAGGLRGRRVADRREGTGLAGAGRAPRIDARARPGGGTLPAAVKRFAVLGRAFATT